MCRSRKTVHEVAEDVADIGIRGSTVSFKIGTEADVTAISEQV